jgi:hypothetical protein
LSKLFVCFDPSVVNSLLVFLEFLVSPLAEGGIMRRAALLGVLLVSVGLSVGWIAQRLTPTKPLPPTTVRAKPLNLRGYNGLVLLSDPLVQNELQLTPQQRAAMDDVTNEFLNGLKPMIDLSRGLPELPKAEQAVRWTAITARQSMQVSDHQSRALAQLSDSQRERLSQIAFQLRLEEVFYQADVSAALRFSGQQLHQIAQRRAEVLIQAKAVYAADRERGVGSVERDHEAQELRRAALAFYESLLDAAQRSRYERLRGEPVRFTKNELRWELRQ